MVNKLRNEAIYIAYLNNGKRLPNNHFPELQYNRLGELILASGEVYCRWRDTNGVMCSSTKPYCNVKSHYTGRHQTTVEMQCRGTAPDGELERLQRYYAAIVAGTPVPDTPRRYPFRMMAECSSSPEPLCSTLCSTPPPAYSVHVPPAYSVHVPPASSSTASVHVGNPDPESDSDDCIFIRSQPCRRRASS